MALWTALLALTAAVVIQKIYSSDYWWHLRAGQLIVDTLSVPRVDPFSYSAPDARWIDIHWLFQVVLYWLHSIGGHHAAILFKLVCVSATLACLATVGYRRDRASVSVGILALVLLTGGYRFMPRPELLSFLFLAAELALFERYRRRRDGWIAGVVVIALVWVNCHGLFALGIAVSLIYLASELYECLRQEPAQRRYDRVKDLGVVAGLSVLVSLANPNFVDGLLYPIRQLGMLGSPGSPSEFSALIVELYSPFHPRSALTPLAASFPAALALLSAGALWLNRRQSPLSDFLLWAAFAYLAATAQRNLPLFAFVAAPIAIRNLNEVLDRHRLEPRTHRWAGGVALAVMVALSWDVASDRFYGRLGGIREAGFGVVEHRFPIGAAEWIAKHRPPGPIYHPLGFGGYLLWRLFPDYESLVDGRLEVFGMDRLVALRAQDYEAFRLLDRHFQFGVVMVDHEGRMPLHYALYLSPLWRLEYVDEVAAVFVRVSKAWSPRDPELDITAADLFSAMPERVGPGDEAIRRKRTNFYTAMRLSRRALEELDRAVELHPELAGAAELRARLVDQIEKEERAGRGFSGSRMGSQKAAPER